MAAVGLEAAAATASDWIRSSSLKKIIVVVLIQMVAMSLACAAEKHPSVNKLMMFGRDWSVLSTFVTLIK